MPQHLALTIAAWLCCVVPMPGFDPGPHAHAMVDPARERLSTLTGSTQERIRQACEQVFPNELAQSNEFVQRVAEYVAVIITDGVRAAAREAARNRTPHQPQASPAA